MSMTRNTKLLPIALLACATLAQAELYKSVGPDGRVTYSDTPTARAQPVDTRKAPAASVSGTALPYELALVVKAHPVTLYTSDKCPPCFTARNLLGKRGIPYTEKTVSSDEDIAALAAVGGEARLPLLTVGKAREQGFEEGAWNRALSAAGYPQTSQLPASWRNPPPQAAAPTQAAPTVPVAPPVAQGREPARLPAEAAPPAGKAPPGFRF
jgi:glutaredoxin